MFNLIELVAFLYPRNIIYSWKRKSLSHAARYGKKYVKGNIFGMN